MYFEYCMKKLFNMYIRKECTLKETMLIKQKLLYYNQNLIEFVYDPVTSILILYFIDYTNKTYQIKQQPWKYSYIY